jgi:peptidyl-prolyl cis-trans isomerase C
MRSVALATSLLLALACKRAEPPPQKPTPPDAVARIGDRFITAADLNSYIESQPPPLRPRYATPAGKQELLEHLIDFELMAADAESRGYARRPDVLRQHKQMMINRLVEEEIAPARRPEDIPDPEAERYYQDHGKELTRDEVHVQEIVVKDRRRADQLAESLKRPGTTEATFKRQVAAHSIDPASKAKEGDLGFLHRNTPDIPQAVIEAAFHLQTPGDLSSPVETPQGFHVLRLAEPPRKVIPPFEEVKATLKARLLHDQRAQKMEAWVSGLRGRVKAEVLANGLSLSRPVPPTSDESATR